MDRLRDFLFHVLLCFLQFFFHDLVLLLFLQEFLFTVYALFEIDLGLLHFGELFIFGIDPLINHLELSHADLGFELAICSGDPVILETLVLIIAPDGLFHFLNGRQ